MTSRERWIEAAGYAALFWLLFFLFAYWTFPYDRVAAYVTDRAASSGLGYTLRIVELSPYWFTGVELSDVVLERSASEPSGEGGPAATRTIRIPELRARVAVLPLLLGDTSVSFDAELERGELDGTYIDGGDQTSIRGTLSEVDIARLGLLDSVLSIPVKGELTGEFDLTFAKQATSTEGSADLTLKGLTIGDGKAKQRLAPGMGGLTVDPIDVGDVRFLLEVKNGVGSIKDMASNGKDLELKGLGDLRFVDPLMRSRVNLLLRARFTDAYRKKSPRTQAMFMMLDNAAEAAPAKTPDGALQFRLSGTLSTLRAMPQGSAKFADPAPRSAPPVGEPSE